MKLRRQPLIREKTGENFLVCFVFLSVTELLGACVNKAHRNEFPAACLPVLLTYKLVQ